MTNVKLTEKHSIEINTIMEKQVLMMLLYDNKFSAVKIGNTSIYLHSNSNGEPEVVYGDGFRISKAKVDIISDDPDNNGNDIWVDVRYVAQQLINTSSLNKEDGKFSYIDWDKKFVTVATDLSDINSRIRFKLDDIPELKSENTEICSLIHPEIDNLGWEENNIFKALIITDIIRAELSIDIDNPLNTYVIEV